MTSINSMTTYSASTLYSTQSSQAKSPIEAAAKLFGMSTSDLNAELKSGKSLDDVAKEKGISTDDLDTALVQSMPPSLASSSDAMTIAKKMAAEAGGPKGAKHGHHAPPAPAASTTSTSSTSTSTNPLLDELSSLLGTDSSSLKSTLTSGTSLSSLLSQKGISMSDLANSLQQGVLLDTTA